MRNTKKEKLKESAVKVNTEQAPVVEPDATAPSKQDDKALAERALKLLDELEGLKGPAIDELLSQRDAINDKLSMLGYNRPAPTPVYSAAPRRTTRSTGVGSGRHCNICSVDGHDARKHRWQKEKRAFTQEELSTLSTTMSAGS